MFVVVNKCKLQKPYERFSVMLWHSFNDEYEATKTFLLDQNEWIEDCPEEDYSVYINKKFKVMVQYWWRSHILYVLVNKPNTCLECNEYLDEQGICHSCQLKRW